MKQVMTTVLVLLGFSVGTVVSAPVSFAGEKTKSETKVESKTDSDGTKVEKKTETKTDADGKKTKRTTETKTDSSGRTTTKTEVK